MSRRSKNLTPTATDTATQPHHHAVPASNACAKVGRRRHGRLIPNRHTVLGAAHSSTALLRVGQVLAHQRLQLLDGLLLRLRQLARGPVAHAVWHTRNTPRASMCIVRLGSCTAWWWWWWWVPQATYRQCTFTAARSSSELSESESDPESEPESEPLPEELPEEELPEEELPDEPSESSSISMMNSVAKPRPL